MPQISLPTPPSSYSPSLLATLFATIRTALGRCIATDEAVKSFLLKSPNGSNYRVSISDAGVITTTAV